jgi:hypothetical protein
MGRAGSPGRKGLEEPTVEGGSNGDQEGVKSDGA